MALRGLWSFMFFAEIMATLKAIQTIASALVYANEQRKEIMLNQELKQIEEFKKDVRIELEQIKAATSDLERKRLLIGLSQRLSN